MRRQDVDNKSLTLSIAPSHLTDNCIDLRTIVSYLDTGSTVLPWHSECSTKYADTLASRIIDGVRKIKDLNSAQVQQLEEALLPKK